MERLGSAGLGDMGGVDGMVERADGRSGPGQLAHSRWQIKESGWLLGEEESKGGS